MIGFLNPLFLYATPASLIPLLIHIFNRRRLRKLDFSSIQLLKTFEKTKLKKIRLKELILLLLRCLIIFLVVLAFARPTWKGDLGIVGSSAQTSAVILLDNSFSMGFETEEGSILDIGKKRALELLDVFGENDKLSLVVFNSELELLTSEPISDLKALKNLIKEASLSFFSTDIKKALAFAKKRLKSSKDMNKEIYLLSDLNRAGWSDKDVSSEDFRDLKLYVVKLWDENKKNVGIENVGFGEDLILKGRPFRLSAKIGNFSQEAEKDLLVALYLDKKRVSQTDVDLKPQSSFDLEFAHSENSMGLHQGFFEIEDDQLLADNRRYFAFFVPEKIRILTLGESSDDNYYLNLALNPTEEKNWRFDINSTTKESSSELPFSEYDVIILSNVKSLSASQLNNLEAFVKKGGGLVMGLNKQIDFEFYNEKIMKKFFGVKLSRPLNQKREDFSLLGKIDFDHPIFQVYKGKGEVPLVKFFFYFETPEKKGFEILARLKNQKPILLEKSFGLGKVLFFLSSFDAEGNDLVLHTFFVPFLNRCVEYLSKTRFSLGFDKDFLVGTKIERELAPSFFGKKIKLVNPQKKEFLKTPDFFKRKLKVKVPETNFPGVYTILIDGITVDQFAVNFDPAESDLEVLKDQEIKKLLKGWKKVFVNPQDDLQDKIRSSRYGKELGKSLLWSAFLLLFLELFLARTKGEEI